MDFTSVKREEEWEWLELKEQKKVKVKLGKVPFSTKIKKSSDELKELLYLSHRVRGSDRIPPPPSGILTIT